MCWNGLHWTTWKLGPMHQSLSHPLKFLFKQQTLNSHLDVSAMHQLSTMSSNVFLSTRASDGMCFYSLFKRLSAVFLHHAYLIHCFSKPYLGLHTGKLDKLSGGRQHWFVNQSLPSLSIRFPAFSVCNVNCRPPNTTASGFSFVIINGRISPSASLWPALTTLNYIMGFEFWTTAWTALIISRSISTFHQLSTGFLGTVTTKLGNRNLNSLLERQTIPFSYKVNESAKNV